MLTLRIHLAQYNVNSAVEVLSAGSDPVLAAMKLLFPSLAPLVVETSKFQDCCSKPLDGKYAIHFKASKSLFFKAFLDLLSGSYMYLTLVTMQAVGNRSLLTIVLMQLSKFCLSSVCVQK